MASQLLKVTGKPTRHFMTPHKLNNIGFSSKGFEDMATVSNPFGIARKALRILKCVESLTQLTVKIS